MTRYNDLVWCDGCGVEIVWPPLIVGERHYCCEDCLEGLPCMCGERMELYDERRTPAGVPEAVGSGVPAK